MKHEDITFWLSVFGALGSFVLGSMKAYEFFSADRIKLKLTVSLTSLPRMGNKITILNQSKIPVNTHYFDLAWVKGRSIFGLPIPFTRKVVSEDLPIEPGDSYEVVIAPHQTITLEFTGADHFNWGAKVEEDIYLRLWLVGSNGPRWLWVTGPSQFA